MDAFVAELRKVPPITRFLCASSLAVSVPVILNLVPVYKVIYYRQAVTEQWEIWRPFTSFVFGTGIGYIFDFVMLYRNSDQLESIPYARRSADYAWQLFFVTLAILGINTPLSCMVHTRPFLVCLTYLMAVLSPPGAQTSLMGLISIPIQYLPYVMVGFDLLASGPRAAAQAIGGMIVGHAWWWAIWGGGVGRVGVLANWGRAPNWLRGYFRDAAPPPPGSVASATQIGGVHVIAPRRTVNGAGSSTSATTTATTGYNWGAGNRLGSS